ncbi:hypothetical protein KCP73_18775 [Salmonella enterica subsp. enterica]|nr:hypothetical protein KCP73_18775 [Salmonella enterica subsp. enterica]
MQRGGAAAIAEALRCRDSGCGNSRQRCAVLWLKWPSPHRIPVLFHLYADEHVGWAGAPHKLVILGGLGAGYYAGGKRTRRHYSNSDTGYSVWLFS